MVRTQLLIVSHSPLFDQGLQAVLNRQPGVRVAGVCRDLETAYAQAQAVRPDILIIISQPEDAGWHAALSQESTLGRLKGLAPTLIRINLADNSVQVLRRRPSGLAPVQMEQATLDDLVKTIQASADAEVGD